LDNRLGEESISGHIIAALIITGENLIYLAGLNFWLDGMNNLLASLLPCKWSIPTIILSKNNFCNGLITQTRCLSDLEARCESLERNLGGAKAICSSILALEVFIFLFQGFRLSCNKGCMSFVLASVGILGPQLCSGVVFRFDLNANSCTQRDRGKSLEELITTNFGEELRRTCEMDCQKKLLDNLGSCLVGV
jgi:hypothetical protein